MKRVRAETSTVTVDSDPGRSSPGKPVLNRGEWKDRMASNVTLNYTQITRQIAALERAVLAFQAGAVQMAGIRAAEESNIAIILAARLSTVWKRLGGTILCRQCKS